MTQDGSRKRRRRSFKARIRLVAVVLVILAGVVITLRGHGYRTFDSGVMALRHIHRLLYYANGWTLPGTPDLAKLDERLAAMGLKRGDPVFIRIFKSELRLELWMKKKDGRFVQFASYPICFWSGRLGPKKREGDHQAPEGFYTVGRGQLNPHSRWHRSFNLGYPNLFDRAHGRTGGYLMVHGGCSSIGCYAMTNAVVDEIWNLITAALDKGQKRFAVHVFPFRLTPSRLTAYRNHPSASFWRDLKAGYDLFEKSRLPPRISVCHKRYVAEPGGRAVSVPPLRAGCSGSGSGV